MVAKAKSEPGRAGATKDVDVRARIDAGTKEQVSQVLGEMGLTTSEAIRLFLTQVAADKKLPFTPEIPNSATREAMAEADAGQGTAYSSLEELFADMRGDDNADSEGDP